MMWSNRPKVVLKQSLLAHNFQSHFSLKRLTLADCHNHIQFLHQALCYQALGI